MRSPNNRDAAAARSALAGAACLLAATGCAVSIKRSGGERRGVVAVERSESDGSAEAAWAKDEALAAEEIRSLHRFFQLWLAGEVPASEAALSRFTEALDPRFTLATPEGEVLDADAVVAWVRDNHGARRPFRLWTEKPTLLWRSDEALLAQYEEWQRFEGRTTARLSTVLFVRDDAAPGQLRWVRVHETWIGPSGEAGSAADGG